MSKFLQMFDGRARVHSRWCRNSSLRRTGTANGVQKVGARAGAWAGAAKLITVEAGCVPGAQTGRRGHSGATRSWDRFCTIWNEQNDQLVMDNEFRKNERNRSYRVYQVSR